MNEKYIAYLRVSTKEQGRSGLGLEAQKRDINLFISNYASESDLLETYTDIVSGSNSSRQALTEAITRAKQLNATLIVSKLDRLVASMPNADKFQLHIYAALAEQERDFISMRTKAALAEKKASGATLGGLRDTTNQRNAEKQRIANENAMRISSLILPMKESGMSLRSIAERLNSNGLSTPQGKSYSAQTVSNAIKRINQIGT